jgi:hypothetical protein
LASNQNRPPVACSLNLRDLPRRLASWRSLRRRAEISFARTDRGIQLIFRNDPGVESQLKELVELERECCAFAEWSTRSDDDRVVLEVSGEGEEAVAAVQGMLRS